jgi:hypothetical protein
LHDHSNQFRFGIRRRRLRLWVCLAILAVCPVFTQAQAPASIRNKSGLRLAVDEENRQPALRIILPDRPSPNRDIQVLFPEHVTARRRGSEDGEHLYLFQPGQVGDTPAWVRTTNSLGYEKDLKGSIHFVARATLQDDGVLFHYEFANRSSAVYDMIWAVTDPRLTGTLHDVRLERTYVHHHDGFDLLASETPERLTMPLNQWLPARYLDSFTWAVPTQHVERRDDGITYYNKSRPVDEPMVATFSSDRKWLIVSFTRTTGNVWSNPELTCQHVDPQATLPPRQSTTLEVKILVIKGSLEDALSRVVVQRDQLH